MSESKRRLILGLQDALGATVTTALNDPDVVEIMLNPDGKLFIERLGQGIAPRARMAAQPPRPSSAASRTPSRPKPTRTARSFRANCRLAGIASRDCCRRSSPRHVHDPQARVDC